MRNFIVFIYLLLYVTPCNAQFSQRLVETDTSYIDITVNGKNKFVEETYKDRDSIRVTTYYYPDSSALKLSGWKNDVGNYFGEWQEFLINGNLLYTLNYATHNCVYNEKLYPYHEFKSKMKAKADSLIIKKFGILFFRNNVVFDYDGHSYRWEEENYPSGRVLSRNKLGDWLHPISEAPHGVVLRYAIKLSNTEVYRNILSVELDTLGHPIKDSVDDAIDFEDFSVAIRNPMSINMNSALFLCKKHPLQTSDYDYKTELKYGFSKYGLHPGEFYYEVTQLYDEKREGNDFNSTVVKYFNVWRINPYTSELYYKKRQKIIVQAGNGYGITGKFLELNE